MKLLWITNITFPEAKKLLEGDGNLKSSGGWMLGSSEALASLSYIDLTVASVSQMVKKLTWLQGEKITYCLLPYGKGNLRINHEYEPLWREVQDMVKPDVVHIHGTEFSHGLAYVDACGSDSVCVSIQGLTSAYNYYYYGISNKDIISNITLRDLIKGTLFQNKKEFKKRGNFEIELLTKVKHVIGRTSWDHARVWSINPNVVYHFCNETLRPEFYSGTWTYDRCNPHSIFVSSMSYPIKGFHQLLKALPIILREFPDTQIHVAGGENFFPKNIFQKLRSTGYNKYLRSLINKYGLKKNIMFLGALDAESMKREYLNANVFVCPSSIENSPNSVGEAQLLGTPVIASYVGGIPDMMLGDEEHLYRFEEIEMLAYKICNLFKDMSNVDTSSMRDFAFKRHNKQINASTLINIYNQVINDCK